MANPRQEQHEATKQVHNTANKMADETSRIGHTVADLNDQAARTGADVAKRSVEAWQAALQSGTELANEIARQSTEQLSRALGVSGDEAEKATQQSSRNIEAMARSTSIMAQSVQDISREYLELWRKITTRSLGSMENFARSRTPQEVLATQSEIVRDNVQEFLQTTRRTAETSIKMADEATRGIADAAQQARRAA
jgi:phasin family protein